MRAPAVSTILVLAVLAAVCASASARPGPALTAAVVRTERARSEHYAIRVRLVQGGKRFSLRVRGQASARTISVSYSTGSLSAAALLDPTYLYERAPGGLAVDGMRWLRQPVASLAPGARELANVHALTPAPLLVVLRSAHGGLDAAGRVFRGTVDYDSVSLHGIAVLLAGIQFRHLRISAFVGRDGLVHRLSLSGRTADGTARLALDAHLYAFGRPVHASPPKPGTFMDTELLQLAD